MTHLKSK